MGAALLMKGQTILQFVLYKCDKLDAAEMVSLVSMVPASSIQPINEE